MYFIKCVLGGALLTLTPAVQAAYQLEDDFNPSNFFDHFDFFTGADPTNGFVDYVSKASAETLGLIEPHNALLGVDSKTSLTGAYGAQASGGGRKSTRILSKKSWSNGLFIADIAHMPPSTCGIWAAYWMLGQGNNWPAGGEIDIIEGVNRDTSTTHTLHTSPGCSFAKQGNCNALINDNIGCQNPVHNPQSYGTGFNKIGGGVYATELTSEAIKIWFFPRGKIPSELLAGNDNSNSHNGHSRRNHPRDIVIGTSGGDRNLRDLIGSPTQTTTASGYPSSPSPTHTPPTSGGPIDPSTWGTPAATFQGGSGCDISQHFGPQQLVFNTALCGEWAGSAFDEDATCKALPKADCANWAPSQSGQCESLPDACSRYVAASPEAFKDAFWKINSVRVYQLPGSSTKREEEERRGVGFTA